MTKLGLDSRESGLPGPGGGQKTTRTIGQSKREPRFQCAGCSAWIEVDTSGLEQTERRLNQSIDSLRQSFRRR